MLKKIVFYVWTVALIAGVVLFCTSLTKDHVFTGTDIEITTQRNLQINNDNVTFQAASDEFFVLHNQKGEVIAGVPSDKPLGWTKDEYFTYGPEIISGGKWLFPVGEASVRFTSNNPVTVTTIIPNTSKLIVWVLIMVAALCFWVLCRPVFK